LICFHHPDKPAVGICKHCQRGLCTDCAAIVDDSLACKDRHEEQVRGLNLLTERGILQARRMGANYARSAWFYLLTGLLFAGFGLYQLRWMGLQALFLLFIGVFLLYVGVANFLESRKFRN
jgi:uncharacterized membrane protein